MFSCLFFQRINDIEKATAGKFRIEQKQREEAKTRKEENNSYPNRVMKTLFSQSRSVNKLMFHLFSTFLRMPKTGTIAIPFQEDSLIPRLTTKILSNQIKS